MNLYSDKFTIYVKSQKLRTKRMRTMREVTKNEEKIGLSQLLVSKIEWLTLTWYGSNVTGARRIKIPTQKLVEILEWGGKYMQYNISIIRIAYEWKGPLIRIACTRNMDHEITLWNTIVGYSDSITEQQRKILPNINKTFTRKQTNC